jgi:broad specificity phosphatase PhoE
MPQAAWDVLSRAVWALGWSGEAESRRNAEMRARGAVDRLHERLSSTVRGDILLVGHGCQNILIGRELRQRGWRGPTVPNPTHGKVSTFDQRP